MDEIIETQKKILEKLEVNIDIGLSRDEASKRRQDNGTFNVVDPPIKCPAWVCCLLPCIKSIPSMRRYREIQPDDAELLRDSKWTRYDAASLVRGDIIKVMEGDTIPADCILLSGDSEVLVDMRAITGEESTREIRSIEGYFQPVKLYYGGRVLQGSAIAVVSAIGPDTLVASLIQQQKFPPRESVLVNENDEEDVGIALLSLEETTIA
mmetsp:Transcript_18421/g.27831  ORF Transcript_18421/g.27831 Transcript_18421/m.27831 type:complete len:209 (-) Transcript_18421:88-714(-)